MAIALVERSLFRGRDKKVKQLPENHKAHLGLIDLVPMTDLYIKVLSDSKIEVSTLKEHSHQKTTTVEIYEGQEINHARIKGRRVKALQRKPIYRYIPDFE